MSPESQPDATALAAQVRSGERSSRELVLAALERIEAANPDLGAVVVLDAERALATASRPLDGPFAGVPFPVKDLLPVPGMRAAFGSRLFAGHVADEPVPLVERFHRAGLVLVGKTASSELGLLGSTETLLDGVTRTPWGPDLSAGGSSGGAAAAVAAGLVPMAHASDGGGSIRLPAALAGLFGFMATRGTVAAATPTPTPFSLLTAEHCVSVSVRDSAALLSCTALEPVPVTEPGPVEPLRIGLYDRDSFDRPASAAARAALSHTAALLEELGHRVEPVAPPPIDGAAISRAFFTVCGAAIDGLERMVAPMLGRPAGPGELEPFTLAVLAWYRGMEPGILERAFATLEEQGARMRGFLERCDLVMCPTVGGERPRLGHLAPHLPFDTLLTRTERLAGFTAPVNPSGAPAMSVPSLPDGDGLPVGVQLVGAPGRDALLFRVAYQLEEADPWAHRIHAVSRRFECSRSSPSPWSWTASSP